MALQNLFKKETKELGKQTATPVNARDSKNSWHGVLQRPVISEKASMQSEKGAYSFVIGERANKHAVAQAVAARFGVDVVSVRIMRTPHKKVRRGRITGWKGGHKKALVMLRPGQKIELA